MGQPIFTNNLWATLGAAASASATTLTLAAGHGARFPAIAAGNWLYITLCNSENDLEIVTVTAVSGDTITVERGADSTAPRAWAIGDRLEARFNTLYMRDMKTYITSTLDAGGFTMTGPLTLARDPVAANMLASKHYVDANFLAKTINYQAPIGFPMAVQLSNTSIGFGWNGAIYCIVDSTNVGSLWTSANFDPNSKADAGAQCVWHVSPWENGAVVRLAGGGGSTLFDNLSPWVMEGLRSDGFTLYIRSIYLRNQA